MKVKNRFTGETIGEFDISPRVDLSGAYLHGADLSGVDLFKANLRKANLREADLSWANLNRANLCGAGLCGANLTGANLSRAKLCQTDLNGANLRRASLSKTDLQGADLSGVKGLQSAIDFMAQFDTDELGFIVYKAFGNTNYNPPDHWVMSPGSFITEIVNQLPTLPCACGVNFATREWVEGNHPDSTLWRCRIRFTDAPGITVPYNTDGKARCERLELLNPVEVQAK